MVCVYIFIVFKLTKTTFQKLRAISKDPRLSSSYLDCARARMTKIEKTFLYANHLRVKLKSKTPKTIYLYWRKWNQMNNIFITFLNIVFLNFLLLTNKFICIVPEKGVAWKWWAKQGPAEKAGFSRFLKYVSELVLIYILEFLKYKSESMFSNVYFKSEIVVKYIWQPFFRVTVNDICDTTWFCLCHIEVYFHSPK